MALKFVKGAAKTTVSAKDLLAIYKKDMGDSIGSFGGYLVDRDRIPTGLFPLDLAIGGGFPRGKNTILFGPESSCKTNVALRAIANHQMLWPELTCIFVDIENSFDPDWARALGVDTDKLMVIVPDYAEQAIDIVEGFLGTEDCGLIVVDSLAAMLTTQEMESSAEKANVGGTGLAIGKLCRKVNHALQQSIKAGRQPTTIYINQTRMKVGVMYGDPEVMPGGNAPKFFASMIVRFYGKNIIDPKVSQVMPVAKEVKFVIKKWKVPILSASGMFEMMMQAHHGLAIGDTNDFNTISEHLKAFGMFEKTKKGWMIMGSEYPTIQPFKDKVYGDRKFGAAVRGEIIGRMLNTGDLLEESPKDAEAAE
jgi:recombination protein RecA